VLVKTDATAADYAVRISSTSVLQNLQGYAILRYPVSTHFRPSSAPSKFEVSHPMNQGLKLC
jgi:hypothetical protein